MKKIILILILMACIIGAVVGHNLLHRPHVKCKVPYSLEYCAKHPELFSSTNGTAVSSFDVPANTGYLINWGDGHPYISNTLPVK